MSFDPEKITFFAKTDARGQQVPFGIRAKDRQRHMYVVGKTGMGKSTLLENMAVQDIQNGEGMAFIDPHGSAAEVLLDYIPEHRVNDVVYFAPFDLENPISFNVMEDVGFEKRHLVVSGLMSTFKKIWVDAWSARMEYILTNALLVLIEYPDTTLLSVNRLFNDKAYRLKVVDYCTDPAVKSFWTDEFANYTERFAAEALPAIQNKIGQFTGNPLIRNIIGQPHSSFDFREMMDQKKIVIMNLSKGLIGETNANLLGSMLTTRIYLAAMSRADLPVAEMKKMPNFYFYVDEFQSFANATFANILSEARKYHLNLIIAHQYIEQMEEEVRDAVFGNVGTTVAFRVGPFDAETLETVFTPRFLAADLVNLGFAQIYLTLMIDGIGSQPFSAVTLPPIAQPDVSCKDMVIAASRKNYTKPRVEVETVVSELHTPTPIVKVEKKVVPKAMPRTTSESTTEKKTITETRSTIISNSVGTGNQTSATPEKADVKPAIAGTPVVTPAPASVVLSVAPTQSTHESTAANTHATTVSTPSSIPAPLVRSGSTERSEHPPRNGGTGRNSRNERNDRNERRPGKGHVSLAATTPRVQSTASVGDLKSILAKIAATPTQVEPKRPEGSNTHKVPRPAPAPSATAVSPLKDALRALEATATHQDRVLPPRPVPVRDVHIPAMTNAERAELAALTAEAEAVLAQIPKMAPQTAVTPEPILFTPKHITDAAMAGVPPLVTPQPQPSATVVTPPPASDDPLDVKRVAKLLRHSPTEKSPFRP